MRNDPRVFVKDSIGALRELVEILRGREVAFLATACVAMLLEQKYPLESRALTSLLYFGAIPLAVALAFRVSPAQLGFGLGDVRFWLPVSLLYLVVAVPLVYVSAQTSGMAGYYGYQEFDPLLSLGSKVGFMIGWEFLFRGFLLLGLKDRLGSATIPVQMALFTLSHLTKPASEALSCIVTGLVWGFICYRGGSFWPGVLMHLAVNYALHCFLGLLAG